MGVPLPVLRKSMQIPQGIEGDILTLQDGKCESCGRPIEAKGVDGSGLCISCIATGNHVHPEKEENSNEHPYLDFLSIILFTLAMLTFFKPYWIISCAIAAIISGSLAKSTVGAFMAVFSVMLLMVFAFVYMVYG